MTKVISTCILSDQHFAVQPFYWPIKLSHEHDLPFLKAELGSWSCAENQGPILQMHQELHSNAQSSISHTRHISKRDLCCLGCLNPLRYSWNKIMFWPMFLVTSYCFKLHVSYSMALNVVYLFILLSRAGPRLNRKTGSVYPDRRTLSP